MPLAPLNLRANPDEILVGTLGLRLSQLGPLPPARAPERDNALYQAARAGLRELAAQHPQRAWALVTGLTPGYEQAAARAALDDGRRVVALLPYPRPEQAWTPETRRNYQELLARITAPGGAVHTLSDGAYSAGKLQVRDLALVEQSDHLLALDNGAATGSLAASLAYAQRQGKPLVNVWPHYLAQLRTGPRAAAPAPATNQPRFNLSVTTQARPSPDTVQLDQRALAGPTPAQTEYLAWLRDEYNRPDSAARAELLALRDQVLRGQAVTLHSAAPEKAAAVADAVRKLAVHQLRQPQITPPALDTSALALHAELAGQGRQDDVRAWLSGREGLSQSEWASQLGQETAFWRDEYERGATLAGEVWVTPQETGYQPEPPRLLTIRHAQEQLAAFLPVAEVTAEAQELVALGQQIAGRYADAPAQLAVFQHLYRSFTYDAGGRPLLAQERAPAFAQTLAQARPLAQAMQKLEPSREAQEYETALPATYFEPAAPLSAALASAPDMRETELHAPLSPFAEELARALAIAGTMKPTREPPAPEREENELQAAFYEEAITPPEPAEAVSAAAAHTEEQAASLPAVQFVRADLRQQTPLIPDELSAATRADLLARVVPELDRQLAQGAPARQLLAPFSQAAQQAAQTDLQDRVIRAFARHSPDAARQDTPTPPERFLALVILEQLVAREQERAAQFHSGRPDESRQARATSWQAQVTEIRARAGPLASRYGYAPDALRETTNAALQAALQQALAAESARPAAWQAALDRAEELHTALWRPAHTPDENRELTDALRANETARAGYANHYRQLTGRAVDGPDEARQLVAPYLDNLRRTAQRLGPASDNTAPAVAAPVYVSLADNERHRLPVPNARVQHWLAAAARTLGLTVQTAPALAAPAFTGHAPEEQATTRFAREYVGFRLQDAHLRALQNNPTYRAYAVQLHQARSAPELRATAAALKQENYRRWQEAPQESQHLSHADLQALFHSPSPARFTPEMRALKLDFALSGPALAARTQEMLRGRLPLSDQAARMVGELQRRHTARSVRHYLASLRQEPRQANSFDLRAAYQTLAPYEKNGLYQAALAKRDNLLYQEERARQTLTLHQAQAATTRPPTPALLAELNAASLWREAQLAATQPGLSGLAQQKPDFATPHLTPRTIAAIGHAVRHYTPAQTQAVAGWLEKEGTETSRQTAEVLRTFSAAQVAPDHISIYVGPAARVTPETYTALLGYYQTPEQRGRQMSASRLREVRGQAQAAAWSEVSARVPAATPFTLDSPASQVALETALAGQLRQTQQLHAEARSATYARDDWLTSLASQITARDERQTALRDAAAPAAAGPREQFRALSQETRRRLVRAALDPEYAAGQTALLQGQADAWALVQQNVYLAEWEQYRQLAGPAAQQTAAYRHALAATEHQATRLAEFAATQPTASWLGPEAEKTLLGAAYAKAATQEESRLLRARLPSLERLHAEAGQMRDFVPAEEQTELRRLALGAALTRSLPPELARENLAATQPALYEQAQAVAQDLRQAHQMALQLAAAPAVRENEASARESLSEALEQAGEKQHKLDELRVQAQQEEREKHLAALTARAGSYLSQELQREGGEFLRTPDSRARHERGLQLTVTRYFNQAGARPETLGLSAAQTQAATAQTVQDLALRLSDRPPRQSQAAPSVEQAAPSALALDAATPDSNAPAPRQSPYPAERNPITARERMPSR